jgi:hypothetical protein
MSSVGEARTGRAARRRIVADQPWAKPVGYMGGFARLINVRISIR